MKTTIKITIVALMAVSFIATGVSAQNHPDTAKVQQHMMKKNMQNNEAACDSSKMMNHKSMMKDHKGMMNHDKMKKNSKGMMNHDKMKKNSKGMMNHGKKMGAGNKMMNNMLHKGVIDVKAIDKNQDGKVYQDMMDWNIISDKPGKCPNCGMKLKEVSIDKAKKNLKEHGFKVK
ncbi:hypothetical protein BMS3Abin04_01030 [bacterium BMS3Abin04]|nr:hypothetical protein BMS3Abin04_01030 [bacterium BMS3Abin04]